MAHAVETAMFVKAPAWHKLGNVLENVPNTEEAFIASGLDWKVEKKPLFVDFNGTMTKTPVNGVFRNTDGLFMGECRDRYQLFQNSEAFDWCKPLAEAKDLWTYEAAGSLMKNGRTCWILLKQGEIELAKQDIIKEYLLFSWSHDGSKTITVMPTSIRVVCNNTLTYALNSAGFRSKIRHSLSMKLKLDEVQKLYTETKAEFQKQEDCFKFLLDVKMTDAQIEEYVGKILANNFNDEKIEDMKDGAKKTILENTKKTLLNTIYNGSGLDNPEVKGTAFACAQGVSEAVEHILGGNKVKDRGNNILFGKGKDIVDNAFDVALTYA